MAQTSRTFRIFVSSTFSDLEKERNALQKLVFPRLRNLGRPTTSAASKQTNFVEKVPVIPIVEKGR